MKTQSITSLKSYFLIAMPGLKDPYFMHSVVYIHEHSTKGATGFIVNKPTNVTIADVLVKMKLQSDNLDLIAKPTLLGGPVSQEQIFLMVHDKEDHSSETVAISFSTEALADVIAAKSKQEAIFFLGCANWEAGQLEAEIAENGWLIVPYNGDVLFHLPFVSRYDAAASLIGVDIHRLSSDVGHA